MQKPNPFKWRQYQAEIILLCVRWYLRYSLSYRDLEEMMVERGLTVDHSTIARWVLAYAPELEKRVKPQLKPTNDSWRVDETYIKVKGHWVYHYRAVDSAGNSCTSQLTKLPFSQLRVWSFQWLPGLFSVYLSESHDARLTVGYANWQTVSAPQPSGNGWNGHCLPCA